MGQPQRLDVSGVARTASVARADGHDASAQRQRARWLLVVISVGVLLLAASYVWLRLTTPSDGAYLAPSEQSWTPSGVVVSLFARQPTELQPGDVVVAIDGRSMGNWESELFKPNVTGPSWHSGQTVVYTVQRAGRLLLVPVTLAPFPWLAFLREDWSLLLYFIVFALVGTYVFARRPAEPAARVLFLSASTLFAANLVWSFGLQLSDITGRLGFWLTSAMALMVNPICWAGFLHFVLLFPRVHPLLRRRRMIVLAIYLLPLPWNLAYLLYAHAQFPKTLEWIAPWSLASNALTLLYGVLIVAVLVSNVLARLDALAQQQLHWIVLAGLVSIGGDVVLWILPGIVLGRPIIDLSALGLLLLPIPLAIAVAVLRYHVFDIDILINRTLVYGTLTLLLALIYFASVVALQQFVRLVVGQESSQNPIIIVLSTLLIAVLFQPLRHRIQTAIDRRFYRSKYDTTQILEQFAATLRSDVDLSSLSTRLLEVVDDTMRPTHLSLWFRPRPTDLRPADPQQDKI